MGKDESHGARDYDARNAAGEATDAGLELGFGGPLYLFVGMSLARGWLKTRLWLSEEAWLAAEAFFAWCRATLSSMRLTALWAPW